MSKTFVGRLASAAVCVSITACSGLHSTGAGAVPSVSSQSVSTGSDLSASASTPGSGQARYSVTSHVDISTRSGPNAHPQTLQSSDSGHITIGMTVDGNGRFTLTTDQKMISGSSLKFTLHGIFVNSGNTSKQYFLDDQYSGADTTFGTSAYSGTDNFPNRELGVIFPLRAGNSWSSLGDDTFTTENVDSRVQNGKVESDRNTGRFTQRADGFYTGRDTWENPSSQVQYAERFDASSPSALSYTLTMPGYSPENWSFSQPASKTITVDVSGSGRSAYPKGTSNVPDWYPGGGALPGTLATDTLRVGNVTVTPPAACGMTRKTNVVEERFSLLDPVGGSTYQGVNRYYGWPARGNFPACVTLEYTTKLVANGIWYVSWKNGEPYYTEHGTSIQVLEPGTTAAVPGMAAGSGSFVGTPAVAASHMVQGKLRAYGGGFYTPQR